ncbi:MAG: SDR family NAD(P)-dependent oxidoreductase, partial [Actinomycetia bacterium]|nr:SDR family NAD(P)-dependent oxidoreductase [Actinomycetes bacterium]
MPRALVTGPTSGIGKEFTRTLAGQGHDLVLVSRDQVRLDELSQELQNKFGVDVRTISADLTNRSDITAIAEVIRNDSFDVLVNNAGFGVKGAFLDTNVDQEQAMLDILITAVMQLSHAALPGMVNRGRGYV